MTEARDRGERERSRAHKSYLWDLGVALLFGLLSFGLSLALSRRSGEVPAIGNAQEQDDEYRRDLRSYLCGISLALPLTVVPFALVLVGDAAIWAVARHRRVCPDADSCSFPLLPPYRSTQTEGG